MDEAHLDLILNELGKNGTDKVEATEEVLEKLKLKGKSMFRNDEIDYLVTQGYLLKETISGWQDNQGKFFPARYFLNLTPEGLKFVSEGGFAAKSGHAKKTLAVATQSRNYAAFAIVIAVLGLFLQLYYGSCNNTVKTSPINTSLIDTAAKVTTDTNKRVQDSPRANNIPDSIKTKSRPIDSITKGSVKHIPVNKKKAPSSSAKN